MEYFDDDNTGYYHDQPVLNPWFSMWTQPRATIQQIVDTDPGQSVLVLAAISGIIRVLEHASIEDLGDQGGLPYVFTMAAISGPIGGIFGLYIFGALIHLTGSWLGGKSSLEETRAAIAWSAVPAIWVSILWIPELVIFGKELFTSATPNIDANPSLALLLLGFFAIELIGGIWAYVAFLKCLGQVQEFSAWKALGNVLLAGLIIIVSIFVILFALSSLFA